MQESTLDFLKDYISDEEKELLRCDPDKIRDDMSGKIDEQRFEEALKRYGNPRTALLLAVHKAENNSTHENIRQVINCAVKVDDFVTALYWHQKLLNGKTVKLPNKFERYYYTLMAERQKQQEPTAEPYTCVRQMCQKASDTSHALRDPQYLERCITYRTQQAKAYQEKFDEVESSVFLPAKKKDENATWLHLLVGIVLLILGGVLLWNTYGIVSGWVHNFFRRSILSLISWIIPILYVLLVIILIILLWHMLTEIIGFGNKEKLRSTVCEIRRKIKNSLEDTESGRILQSMNSNLQNRFRDYDARLILAATSAMSGERNMKKLCEMANEDESTWLTRLYPPQKDADNPYENKVNSLIRKKAPDSDLFLGYTLQRKQSPFSATYEVDFITIYRNISFDSSDHQNNKILFDMVERFLREEALMAESRGDKKRMGEACYELYKLYIHASTLFADSMIDQMAYQYGSLGVDHCDELKYHIMYTYACHHEYDDIYNPYLSLGYERADAEAYASELIQKEDPRGKELQKHFKDVDRWTAERAEEAAKAEAEAYWEEQSRLRAEAEAAREKARTELNEKMDRIERETNLFLHNSFATEEERALGGEKSTQDWIRHQNLRDEVIRHKLDDM